jgi:hypothetical protein
MKSRRSSARPPRGRKLPPPVVPSQEGLTLADLQAIGNEVGIAPDAVAQAALSLEVRRPAAARTLLGLPIGVERSITLNRWLSDAEWDLLVVELREVFNARGTVKSYGSLREWRNGNLQALLEPTPAGHRLRLKTTKGDARTSIVAGLVMLGTAAMLTLGTAFGGVLSRRRPCWCCSPSAGWLCSPMARCGCPVGRACARDKWKRSPPPRELR